MRVIYFKINNLIPFELVVDSETYLKLKNVDSFAWKYMEELIITNVVNIDEEIQMLYRSENNVDYSPVRRESAEREESRLQDVEDSSEHNTNSDNIWTDAETKYLLDKYESYLNLVGPLKRFKTKKVMYNKISEDMLRVLGVKKNAVQCENRYKTVIKRKKKALDNNRTSGASRVGVQYEEELNKITALDDSIQPEVLRSAGECSTKRTEQVVHSTKRVSKEPSIQEVLQEISRKKEENKERRHAERLQALRDLGKMLVQRKRGREATSTDED